MRGTLGENVSWEEKYAKPIKNNAAYAPQVDIPFSNVSETIHKPWTSPIKQIICSMDNGDSALAASTQYSVPIRFNGTIVGWDFIANAAGSCKIDVWKDTIANYPPTDADSITNGHEPELVNAAMSSDTNVNDWSVTQVQIGETIRFNIDSNSTITSITLSLNVLLTY